MKGRKWNDRDFLERYFVGIEVSFSDQGCPGTLMLTLLCIGSDTKLLDQDLRDSI